MSKYDKIIEKVKENKVLVAVILIGIIVISLGDFSEAITKIVRLFGGHKTTEISKLEMASNKFAELIQKIDDGTDKRNKETLSNLLYEKEVLECLEKFIAASNRSKEEARSFIKIFDYHKEGRDDKNKKLKKCC